jgi:hypothetical protein
MAILPISTIFAILYDLFSWYSCPCSVLGRHKQFNILLRRSVQEHLRRWNIIITQVSTLHLAPTYWEG